MKKDNLALVGDGAHSDQSTSSHVKKSAQPIMNSPKGTGSHKFGSMVTPSPGKPHTKFLQDVNGHRVL